MDECKTAGSEPRRVGEHIDTGRISQMPPRMAQETQDEREERERAIVNAKRWNAWNSLVGARGERYAACRLSNFNVTNPEQEKVLERIKGYLDALPERIAAGDGLMLYGPKGCGKDHLIMSCARVAIGHDFSVQWVNGMDLFACLRNAMNPECPDTEESIYKEVRKHKILWISDPAPPTGALTEFQQSFLFRVLDYRYSHVLPTWVTCNVTSGAELDSRIGAQNGDRLRHGTHAIFTNWDTFRKVSKE